MENNKIQIKKIKINKIQIENNLFKITDTNKNIFIGKIIKGSVNFKIFNENNEEVSINNIEEGDIIKIQTSDKKLEDLHEQKNSLIKKIIIKNKYTFNLESSEEFEEFETDTDEYFS
jgi:hypothetical protein